jgi:type I restriction enzyme S subunit
VGKELFGRSPAGQAIRSNLFFVPQKRISTTIPNAKHQNQTHLMNQKNHSADNIPQLRFPEFVGEWEKKKLGEVILKLDSGVSVNSNDEPVNEFNKFGILKTSCISKGRFNPEQNKQIIYEEIGRAKLNPVKGSIMISRMNTPQLVGESGYIEKDYPNLFVPDRLWMTHINVDKTNSKFLSIVISSNDFMTKISNIATGTSGSMKNISKPNFLNLEMLFPTLPEQTRIANFLTAVDEKIQALKKKKGLLEAYKKGVMQRLFSQVLRFKGDDGQAFADWEVKKLGEVGEIIMGQSPDSNSYNSDKIGIPLIQGNADIQNRLTNPRNYTTQATKKCEIGDLILTVRAPVGAVAKSMHNACIGRGVCSIRNKANSDIEFIFQFLLDYETKWASLEQGSTFTAVSGIEIKKLPINLPTPPEQTQIANFLSAIDDKIKHNAVQIQKMEVWKKGLLQKMFV